MPESMFDPVTLDALRVDRQTSLGERVAALIKQASLEFMHERVKTAEACITIKLTLTGLEDALLIAPAEVRYRGPKLTPIATHAYIASDGRVVTQDQRRQELPLTLSNVAAIDRRKE